MDRRSFLLGSVGGLSALAGCQGWPPLPTADPQATRTPGTSRPLAELGTPATICEQDVFNAGIPAIVSPAFSPNWSDVSNPSDYAWLADDTVVIGVSTDSLARAYPLTILWEHEIVNDRLPAQETGTGEDRDIPLLVTYCPLCRSGMVAERRVDGVATPFIVSGQLWVPPQLETRMSEADGRVFAAERDNASSDLTVRSTGNLVMVDEHTESYWSQMLARAICGPRRGDRLRIIPSTVARWADWRASHPGTQVLLPPPESVTTEG